MHSCSGKVLVKSRKQSVKSFIDKVYGYQFAALLKGLLLFNPFQFFSFKQPDLNADFLFSFGFIVIV